MPLPLGASQIPSYLLPTQKWAPAFAGMMKSDHGFNRHPAPDPNPGRESILALLKSQLAPQWPENT